MRALNPGIYLVSLLPGLAVLCLRNPASGGLLSLAGATLGVVLLQHGINVLNDVTDWIRGADVEKYDSWILVHRRNLTAARIHGFVSLLLGAALGIGVLWTKQRMEIALVALPLVALGSLYNLGKRPLAYTAWGEWVTGVCYAGVFGCLAWLDSSISTAGIVWGSTAFGLLAVAVLLRHQPRQVLTDSIAGKLSFAVRYGARATYRVAAACFAGFVVSLALAKELA